MNWIIIPARKGSKGFPRKNRVLFDYTAKTIPSCMKRKVIVTSNDDEILQRGEYFGFDSYTRSDSLSRDETPTKDVLKDVIVNNKINDKDILIMLYLTYPNRGWDEVEKAFNFFQTFEANSLLCREELSNEKHPFLWLMDNEDGTGKQLVKHNLCRRQDYPKMFKICHYIFMCRAKEIDSLNSNLYNEKTVFFPIDQQIDVDCEEDFLRFKKRRN